MARSQRAACVAQLHGGRTPSVRGRGPLRERPSRRRPDRRGRSSPPRRRASSEGLDAARRLRLDGRVDPLPGSTESQSDSRADAIGGNEMRMIGSVGGFVAGLLIALLLATPALALGDWPNAPWAIPTANYVGSYVYGTPTSWGPHTGVDILTNNDCTPSGSGARGADVYAASNAQVVYLWWLWRMSDGSYQVHSFDGTGQLNVIGSTKYGVSLYDSSQPQASYQYYWHMADQQTFDSYVSTALQPNQTVTMGTYLGTQGNATGTGSVCTHLHFTASTSGTGDSWSAAVDPSPLLGPDLNDDANGRVPAGY